MRYMIYASTYWHMPAPYPQTPLKTASAMSGLSLFATESETPLSISDLNVSSPIVIDMGGVAIDTEFPECRYWSETFNRWMLDGVTTERTGGVGSGLARCKSTHLTEFTIMAAPDNIPPTLVRMEPQPITGKPFGHKFPEVLRLVFSEKVRPGSSILLQLYDGAKVTNIPGDAVSGAGTTNLTINTTHQSVPLFDRQNGATNAYELRVPAGSVQDVSGNIFANLATIIFTCRVWNAMGVLMTSGSPAFRNAYNAFSSSPVWSSGLSL